MDLLVPEDHTVDAGTEQNHAGHVYAVLDKESILQTDAMKAL